MFVIKSFTDNGIYFRYSRKLCFGNENAKDFFLKGIDATVEGLNIKYDVNDLKNLIVTTHNDVLWRNESSHFEKICVAANGDKYTYDVSVVLLKDEMRFRNM